MPAASRGSPRTRLDDSAGVASHRETEHSCLPCIRPSVARRRRGQAGRPIFDEAVARFAAHKALFIGDRLDTDIAGAQAAGLGSVLVLTGIDRPKHVLAAPPTARPTFILGDLRELHEYPETVVQGEVTSVRDAAVRIDGRHPRRVGGFRPIDLVRAGAAAIWGHRARHLRVPRARAAVRGSLPPPMNFCSH
jgi:hypothetical protein